MAECDFIEGVYLEEAKLPVCLKNNDLLHAWNQSNTELVNVSGGRDTGGGVAIAKSLLPHLEIEENETFVLTAAHIVSSGRPTLLGTYDVTGRLQHLYRGQVLYTDVEADLALLKVTFKDRSQRPKTINFYDLRQARAGETAFAFRPEDETRSVGVFTVRLNDSYGAIGGAEIRARNPKMTVADTTKVTLLNQLDLDGTSGSPLIGGDSRVLGIVSQRLSIPRVPRNSFGVNEVSESGTVVISSEQIKKFLEKVDQNAALATDDKPQQESCL